MVSPAKLSRNLLVTRGRLTYDMSAPVTVAVRRESHHSQASEVMDWIESGLTLARNFDGCLGGGILRDAAQTNVVHVVYRFRSRNALRRWECSEERRHWALSGAELVSQSSVQRRTGLEGWFEGIESRHTDAGQFGTHRKTDTQATTPPRWKQAIAIWIGMFPLNVVAAWLALQLPWWEGLWVPARSLLLVTVLVPIMTFVVMPTVTRVLHHWLSRDTGGSPSNRALRNQLNAQKLLGRHHDNGHGCI